VELVVQASDCERYFLRELFHDAAIGTVLRVQEIAKAMVATAKQHPATSATYHYPELMALIASAVPIRTADR
jgi:hypothetical protein